MNGVDDHQRLAGKGLNLANSTAIELRGDLLAARQMCEVFGLDGSETVIDEMTAHCEG